MALAEVVTFITDEVGVIDLTPPAPVIPTVSGVTAYIYSGIDKTKVDIIDRVIQAIPHPLN